MIYIKEYADDDYTAFHKYLPLIGRGYDPREALESLASCMTVYVDESELPPQTVEQRPDRWVAHSKEWGFTVYGESFSEVKYNYLLSEAIVRFRNEPLLQDMWRSLVCGDEQIVDGEE